MKSALRELRSLAGLLEACLLTLGGAGIAGQEASLLEGRTVSVAVDLVEGARHAEAQGTGLAGDAAAIDAGDDVEAAVNVEQDEGGLHQLLVQLVGEVVLEGATVDGPLAGAGDEANAGNGLLAAAQARAGRGDGLTGAGGSRLGLGRVGAGDDFLVQLSGNDGLSHGSPQGQRRSVTKGH